MKPFDRAGMSPELIEELREDFAEVDDDQDGSIDYGEFTILMDNLNSGMTDSVLRIGFGEIDADHDGRISLAEFIAWRSR